MAGTVRQQIEIVLPIAAAIRRFTAQRLTDRIGIGCRSVNIHAIDGANRIRKELPLFAAIRASRQDIRIGDPVIPA